MTPAKLDLSVIIITLNEERRIANCLDSLPEGCEVIVVDSQSCDKTASIATKRGAIVKQRAFDNFAAQKNYALSCATRKWVFSIDADELVSKDLCGKVIEIVNSQGLEQHIGGFRLHRRLVFMNKRLRFGKSTDRPLRLFLRDAARFTHEIHEVVEIPGTVKTLHESLTHFSYEDLTDYFSCLNHYTSEIAKMHFHRQKPGPNIFFHVARPWLDFLGRYFLRLGFLDGYPGYSYALLSSVYGFVKYAKLLELKSKQQRKI